MSIGKVSVTKTSTYTVDGEGVGRCRGSSNAWPRERLNNEKEKKLTEIILEIVGYKG